MLQEVCQAWNAFQSRVAASLFFRACIYAYIEPIKFTQCSALNSSPLNGPLHFSWMET